LASMGDPWASRFPFPGWERLEFEEDMKLRKRLRQQFQPRRPKWLDRGWDFPWSVTYDLGRVLYLCPDEAPDVWVPTWADEASPDFNALVEDLYAQALQVVFELTARNGFIYAWGDHARLRFRPYEGEPKPTALRIPEPFTEGDHCYFAPDFAWAFSFDQISVSLFGHASIEAFERHKPRVFTLGRAISNPT
jgi:hypothetical protein